MHLETFRGRNVLVTGHTGFKGTWLSAWLTKLGANVTGVALDPATTPSHFDAAHVAGRMRDIRLDIRDRPALERVICEARPDFVFHLAAQAIVRTSYSDPVGTWQTNVMGTLHVLEALRRLESPCVAVLITSDKAYDNVEWVWGYRETDALGGPDPYSASKGGAELAIRSYIKSFFPRTTSAVRIAVARAGNVIGGGDWAADRIVPDCVRAWAVGETVDLRNPLATRPWQHVLEPLSGYLTLAMAVERQAALHGEPFNFGPQAQQNHTVLELVQSMAEHWSRVRWRDASKSTDGPYESGLLKLNCDKALHTLKWHAVMNFEETVRMTVDWYRTFYETPERIGSCTDEQIAAYTTLAGSQGMIWAQ